MHFDFFVKYVFLDEKLVFLFHINLQLPRLFYANTARGILGGDTVLEIMCANF